MARERKEMHGKSLERSFTHLLMPYYEKQDLRGQEEIMIQEMSAIGGKCIVGMARDRRGKGTPGMAGRKNANSTRSGAAT